VGQLPEVRPRLSYGRGVGWPARDGVLLGKLPEV
jgi:hypothetical protein